MTTQIWLENQSVKIEFDTILSKKIWAYTILNIDTQLWSSGYGRLLKFDRSLGRMLLPWHFFQIYLL